MPGIDTNDPGFRRLCQEAHDLEEAILDQLGTTFVGHDARAAIAALLCIAGKVGRRSGVPWELYAWMAESSAFEYRDLVEKKHAKAH